MNSSSKNIPLRHAVATLAFRASKTLRDSPAGFAETRISPATRSSVEILSHMTDLLDWALRMANGAAEWEVSSPADWKDVENRFFSSLKSFDDRLEMIVTAERADLNPCSGQSRLDPSLDLIDSDRLHFGDLDSSRVDYSNPCLAAPLAHIDRSRRFA